MQLVKGQTIADDDCFSHYKRAKIIFHSRVSENEICRISCRDPFNTDILVDTFETRYRK